MTRFLLPLLFLPLLAGLGSCRTGPSTVAAMQRVPTDPPQLTTCLWFAAEAEQAARYYTSIVPDSRILGTSRWGEGGFGPPGSVIEVTFELAGQRFMALNGAQVGFTEAVSLIVDCASQAEIDAVWDRLVDGGRPGQCGWLVDRYGVSWQVVPKRLIEMVRDPDPSKAKAVMDALHTMQKIDLATLEAARARA
jgi:predicted 3-demethylubiquinone-9 3-methyltransferase (glyoxalase superfamily)